MLGYSAIATGFTIKWSGGDGIAVYSNGSSTMTYTINGTSISPSSVNFSSSPFTATFTGLTNVLKSVVITSTIGTRATGSISVPIIATSLSAGATNYLNVPSPTVVVYRNITNTLPTPFPITSSFTRLYQQFDILTNSSYVEIGSLKVDVTTYDQYNYHTEMYQSGSSIGLNTVWTYKQSTSGVNYWGNPLVFDKITPIIDSTYHTVKVLYSGLYVSIQVDSGPVQTIGPTLSGFYIGANYNITSVKYGDNFGWPGSINYKNLLITN
jgi:hypothetical protein